MAELDTQRVLQIDAQQAETTLASLRTALKEARAELNTLTVGSDDYKAKLKEVEAAQNGLTNATRVGTAELRSAETVLADNNASYNELSRTMSQLKQEWKSMTNEVERDKLGEKINAINDRLKDMDASVGVFGRNVGNYAKGVAEGFSSIGGAAGAVINPVKGVTAGFQALSKTPVIAIIGLLINLFAKVISTMKSTEDGTKALTSVMGLFSNIADVVTKGVLWLADGVSRVTEGVTRLLRKIGLLGEESEKRIELGNREIEIEQERRRVTEENADIELEIAKKRAQSTDKINNSAKERVKLIKEVGDLEMKVMQNNLALAEMEYKAIKERNALLPSSTEEMQAESDAYAKMQQAQAAYYNKQRELNAQMTEATRQMVKDENDLKTAIEGTTVALEVQQETLEERIKRRTKYEKQWREELLDIEEEFAENYEEGLLIMAEGEQRAADITEEAEQRKIEAKKQGAAMASDIMKNAAKIAGEQTAAGKGLAVAATTIDTYQSAVAAYKSMVGIPIVGPGLAAAAAAAAITAGLANVKSILAVDTSGRSTTMGTGANRVSVSNYAPAVVQQVPLVRQLTNAAQEETLNRIAQNTSATAQNTGGGQPIKAYVVLSDLEAKQNYSNRREQETTF